MNKSEAALKLINQVTDKLADTNRSLHTIAEAGGTSPELVQVSAKIREAKFWLGEHAKMTQGATATSQEQANG